MPEYVVLARDRNGRITRERKRMNAEEARAVRKRMRFNGFSAVRVVPVRESVTGHRAHTRRLPDTLSREERVLEDFEKEYGTETGERIYYATKRERGISTFSGERPLTKAERARVAKVVENLPIAALPIQSSRRPYVGGY